MKKLITGTALLFASITWAGGFQLNVQGGRAVGMGGAFTGIAYGPSTVFFNPGGMTNLKGHNFMGGINLIFPTVSLQTDANDNIDQTSGLATPFHFYYSGEVVEDKVYVGLAVNNLFGSSSSFDDDWEGRYIVQNIGLKTFSFQPTVAFKMHDKISLGAGFVLTTGSFSFEKAVPLGSDEFDYGKASLSGSGIAYSFNTGLNIKAVDNDKMRLNIGVDYRYSQKIDLKNGTAEFTDIPVSLQDKFPATTAFTSSLTLPQVVTAGFSFKYNLTEEHSLMVAYDFNYTSWSSYDTLAFDFENADTPDSQNEKLWQNSPTHRFGLEYGYKNMLFIRLGGYYDITPIQDGYVSPELPDATQFVPTAGVGVLINEKIGFDIAWIHQNAEREAALTAAGWNAKYHRIADVITFSASFKF